MDPLCDAAVPALPLSSLAVPTVHELQSRPAQAAERQAGDPFWLPPSQPREQAAGLQLQGDELLGRLSTEAVPAGHHPLAAADAGHEWNVLLGPHPHL